MDTHITTKPRELQSGTHPSAPPSPGEDRSEVAGGNLGGRHFASLIRLDLIRAFFDLLRVLLALCQLQVPREAVPWGGGGLALGFRVARLGVGAGAVMGVGGLL